MTSTYIKRKIEAKAATTKDSGCLICYCIKKFSCYFSDDEIIEIVNNVTRSNSNSNKHKYKSPFILGN